MPTSPDPAPPRLAGATLVNLFAIGPEPARITFGRRLTLIYGENGVGKSALLNVLALLSLRSKGKGVEEREDWWDVPPLDGERHRGRGGGVAECAFEYDQTLPHEPPAYRSITIRWPAFDLADYQRWLGPETGQMGGAGAALLRSAREVIAVPSGGVPRRWVLYYRLRRTVDRWALADARTFIREIPPEGPYLLADEPALPPHRGAGWAVEGPRLEACGVRKFWRVLSGKDGGSGNVTRPGGGRNEECRN